MLTLYVSQEIGWEEYSLDIFSVKGLPLRRPYWRIICCNGFV